MPSKTYFAHCEILCESSLKCSRDPFGSHGPALRDCDPDPDQGRFYRRKDKTVTIVPASMPPDDVEL
jgi:hypothetical protein